MPTLDLSDMFAPELMDEFVVIRRTQYIDDHGRTQIVPQNITAYGAVYPSSPNDLERLPEGETITKAITIITHFRIRGPSRNSRGIQSQPDHINWHSTEFVVRDVNDYSGFGRGFVSVIAMSIQPVGPAPKPDPYELENVP
jgi:hypothetical protein